MNEYEYDKAIQDCLEAAAGGGNEWNRRFVDALAAHKLKLVTIDSSSPDKPYYIQAPMPFSIGQPSWSISWIEEIE